MIALCAIEPDANRHITVGNAFYILLIVGIIPDWLDALDAHPTRRALVCRVVRSQVACALDPKRAAHCASSLPSPPSLSHRSPMRPMPMIPSAITRCHLVHVGRVVFAFLSIFTHLFCRIALALLGAPNLRCVLFSSNATLRRCSPPTFVFFLNRLTSQTNRRVVRLHCSHNYCVSRLPICSRVCAEAILLGPHFKVFFSLSVRVRGWVNPRVDHRLFVVSIGKSCGLKMMRFANSLFNENRRSIFDMCDKDDFFK